MERPMDEDISKLLFMHRLLLLFFGIKKFKLEKLNIFNNIN